MDYTQIEDQALLKLILSEARAEALDELYGRYGRLVYSVAFRIVGDRQTAEEITLDAFVKVWEKADTYQPRLGSVRVWVTGMTRNRAIDILRRQSVRLDAQSMRWADLTSQPTSKEPDPEATVDLNLRKQRVRRAITQLPENSVMFYPWLIFKDIHSVRSPNCVNCHSELSNHGFGLHFRSCASCYMMSNYSMNRSRNGLWTYLLLRCFECQVNFT